jgi:predicted aspartyl protease
MVESAARSIEAIMRLPAISRRMALTGALATIAAAPGSFAVPLSLEQGACVVPVMLDGHPAHFIIDTGAERSIITHTAAARLKLAPDPWVGTTLQDAGGRLERFANVMVRSARIGNTALLQRTRGPLSIAVTGADLGMADGLLGGDILHNMTVDLDLPRRTLALWPGQAPATPSAGGVRLQPLRRTLLLAPVQLDGRALTALLDTGATRSLINDRGLYKLGLAASMIAHDQGAAINAVGGASTVRMHAFHELRLAGKSFAQPVVAVVDVTAAAYDLTIGIDILGQQRVLLSYPGLMLKLCQG